MENDKLLVYTVAAVQSDGEHNAIFWIEVQDEYTLGYLEKKYSGVMTFDGARTFTFHIVVPIKNMSEREPTMWAKLLKEHPQMVSAFVLERLRGNV